MSTGRKLPLADADRIAREIQACLAPACHLIDIAGSVRRRRPEVGDIEIVAVPRFVDGPVTDLFAPPPKVSALDERIPHYLASHPTKPANGPRYKRLWLAREEVQIDLFIVLPPADYAVILAIRTGPADYSRRVVTALRDLGMRCEDGAIWRGTERVPCPDERTFFRLAGMEWMEPEDRR